MLTLSLNGGVLGQIAAPSIPHLYAWSNCNSILGVCFFQERHKGFHQTLKRVYDPKSSETVGPEFLPTDKL